METKNIPSYFCEKCNYRTANKKDFKKHTLTAKHISVTVGKPKKSQQQYSCECGKLYLNKSGLWKHKKKCSLETVEDTQQHSSNQNETNSLVVQLLQEQKAMREENKEMREAIRKQSNFIQQQQEQHNKQIQELIPKLQQVTTINNTTTNNNTKFNLNFFLNEQCKDAISIQTFMRDLNIGIKELEHMGNVGYLQGMISIMSNTLCAMDIYKRPVHCTDLKRETIYIKDGDTWKKDNANNDDLKKVIDDVADVNYRNLQLWETQHPEAFECDTPDNIEYCKIALESLGGGNNNEEQAASKLNKIIKHVVREVYVK